ncbi:MAG: DUF2125 domain-containing protein [Oceanicaulis sp.]
MGGLFQRSRLGLILPFAALVAVMIVHAIYWIVISGVVEDRARAWIAAQERAGYEIEHQGLRVGGYPFRFTLHAAAPTITAPVSEGGWRAELQRLAGTAQFYNLDHWIVTFGGPARLTAQGETGPVVYQVGAETARLSLAASSGATTRVGGDLDAVTFSAESGPAPAVESAGQVRLSGFIDADDRFSFAVEAREVRLAETALSPEVRAAFGDTAALARMAGALTDWSVLSQVGDPYAWTAAGGHVEVAAAQLVWGPADLNGSGEITLDGELRPAGRLSLIVTDPDTLITALVDAGLVYHEQGEALRLFALMAPRRDTGIALPFRLQDGGLFLGPARLGSVGAVD